jgi:hypothetical protein
MISKFIPDVSNIDVERVLKREYALGQIEQVYMFISLYGLKERPRLVLACLKKAKGNFKDLCSYLFHAQDYCMEYMAFSESPNSLGVKEFDKLSEQEKERIVNLDKKQYLDWLV